MVVMPKQNGNRKICLELKDFKCAVLCEHYPLPTIVDVVTRLHGEKFPQFSKFVVASGTSLWMRSHLRSKLSTHHLVAIDGDYHLESALPRKCFNAEYIS